MGFSECSLCKRKAGGETAHCASLHRVELAHRVAPLCCECLYMKRYKGEVKKDGGWEWTSGACQQCRDRKHAKCQGVYNKRALSNVCVCGLAQEHHSAPNNQGFVQVSAGQKAIGNATVSAPGGRGGYNHQSDVGGATPQGAWDIATPPAHQRASNGVGTPDEWARFTDIPDPYDLQILHDDEDSSRHIPRANYPVPSQIRSLSPPRYAGFRGDFENPQQNQQMLLPKWQLQNESEPLSPHVPGLPGGRLQRSDSGKLPGQSQKSEPLSPHIPGGRFPGTDSLKFPGAESDKDSAKVAMRTKSSESCDTLAELADMLRQERAEKESVYERYKALEQQMEGTVQHVVKVMGDDKKRLQEHANILEARLASMEKDNKILAERVRAGDKQMGEVKKENADVRKRLEKSTRELEKSGKLNKAAYPNLKIISDETEQQLSSGQHGAEVALLCRNKLAEKLAVAQARDKVISSFDQRAEANLGSLENIRGEHAALLQYRSRTEQRIEDLLCELEELRGHNVSTMEELMALRSQSESLMEGMERTASLEREMESLREDLRKTQQRALNAEDALYQLATETKTDMMEADKEKGGVCWSVQKGGIKVLRTTPRGVDGGRNQINESQSTLGGSSASVMEGSPLGCVAPNHIAEGIEINSDEVQKIAEIAEGSFGIVYRGEWMSASVAIKEMRIPAANLRPDEIESIVTEYRTEVSKLCQMRHPNVLSFFGTITRIPALGMVTELMEKDMRKYLKGDANKDPLHHRLGLARQGACGLAYLHRLRVVHRDVKPENFLLSGEGNRRIVKVCDFGLARAKQATHISTMRVAGTMTYIAPEVHRGEQFDEKSDVYSHSVVTWELITGGITPYSDKPSASIPGIVGWGQQRPSLQVLATALALPGVCPSDRARALIVDLLSDGWHHEPIQRLSMFDNVKRLEECIEACSSADQ